MYQKGKLHPNYKHGMGSTEHRNILYQKWSSIKRRCLNKSDKSYPRYGGAGIIVSPEWIDFVNFYDDMHESYFKGASIDRIDNNKGYSKENCRWIELKEQGKNRRVVKSYTLNGKTLTCREWSEKIGVSKDTVYMRINVYGWSIKKALTTPNSRGDGVYLDKKRNLWILNYKKKFLGRFKNKQEALNYKSYFLAEILK